MARTQCHRISQRLIGLTNLWVFGDDAKGEKKIPKDLRKQWSKNSDPTSQSGRGVVRTLFEGWTSGHMWTDDLWCVWRWLPSCPLFRRLANISIVLTLRLLAQHWCVLLSYLIIPLNSWRHTGMYCPAIWYHHTGDTNQATSGTWCNGYVDIT